MMINMYISEFKNMFIKGTKKNNKKVQIIYEKKCSVDGDENIIITNCTTCDIPLYFKGVASRFYWTI